jgi:hypothetical protein
VTLSHSASNHPDRNRDDEQVACRGSIALATANLTQTEDGMRFEISSAVSTSVPKISVKSDRAEIVRWVQAIRLNQDYYSTGGRKKIDRVPSSSNTTKSPSINSHMNELPPADTFLHPGLKRSGTVLSGISSSTTTPQSPRVIRKPSAQSTIPPATGNVTSSDAASSFADQGSLYDDREDSQGHSIPYESEFSLGMLDLDARLKLTQELVGSIVTPPSSAKNSPDPSRPASSTTSRQQEVKDALRDSLVSITALVHKQHEMALEREKFFQTRIKREVQARKLWEDNLLAVAEQQAETDLQLKEAAKDNERKRRALRQARGVLAEFSLSTPASPGGEPSVLAGNNVVETPERENSVDLGAPPTGVSGSQLSASLRNTLTRGGHGSRRSFSLTKSKSRASISAQEFSDVVAAIDDSEDDDDEFFDAIETGTIPNLKMYDSIAHPERPSTPSAETPAANKDAHAQAKEGTIAQLLARESLEPYNHVRHRLPIDDDKRPSVSLWSILKSSIGKDLTKITFPVSFNECTSMLQRMAEDMEYDACLTVAASEQDSLKRVAFVAAFAMSNYSSTIGRIAKPFNPLLSQTFEYAIPNRYRYVSEQVSHHPPVSACYCEAPTWKYYGEVDAKNKFQGSYFEIRPTGIAHAELIIPRSWVPANLQHKYPDAGPEYPDGYVIEHYSWKKVITNVSNFLMGNPIIDHYGDLVVTNHRTGETSTLTFKPRGWRRKDACEIKGDVRTADGEVEWEIAGREYNRTVYIIKAFADLFRLGLAAHCPPRRDGRGPARRQRRSHDVQGVHAAVAQHGQAQGAVQPDSLRGDAERHPDGSAPVPGADRLPPAHRHARVRGRRLRGCPAPQDAQRRVPARDAQAPCRGQDPAARATLVHGPGGRRQRRARLGAQARD